MENCEQIFDLYKEEKNEKREEIEMISYKLLKNNGKSSQNSI